MKKLSVLVAFVWLFPLAACSQQSSEQSISQITVTGESASSQNLSLSDADKTAITNQAVYCLTAFGSTNRSSEDWYKDFSTYLTDSFAYVHASTDISLVPNPDVIPTQAHIIDNVEGVVEGATVVQVPTEQGVFALSVIRESGVWKINDIGFPGNTFGTKS